METDLLHQLDPAQVASILNFSGQFICVNIFVVEMRSVVTSLLAGRLQTVDYCTVL